MPNKKPRSAKPAQLPDRENRFRVFHDTVSPWLSKGSVYGFAMHDELSPPTILEGESAICALTPVTTGSVLGITSGKRGHVFYFHPSFYVVDLGILSDKPVTGGAIVRTQADIVVGGWRGERGGGLFRHDAAREIGTGQEDFRPRKDPVVPIKLPGRGEGVLAMVYDSSARKVYAATTANRIVSLSDDSTKPQIEAQSESALAPALVKLPGGYLLGGCEQGRLWRWRLGERKIQKLDSFAPCEKGKRYVAGVFSLVATEGGLVYGGGAADGFFFSYEPALDRLVNLGKPLRQGFIRALVEGHDGLIYGVTGEPNGMARLFCFDPDERAFEDLGIINTFIPVQWAAHSFGAACTGNHGEIFLGESDTISHLFVYYPPVARKRPDEVPF